MTFINVNKIGKELKEKIIIIKKEIQNEIVTRTPCLKAATCFFMYSKDNATGCDVMRRDALRNLQI